MDLSELIMNIQQLAPQLASTCCVINGAFMTLEDVEKMGYDEFLYRSKINMPLRLYKYFSNAENDKEGSKVNYSMIYEMQECSLKCEDCVNFMDSGKK